MFANRKFQQYIDDQCLRLMQVMSFVCSFSKKNDILREKGLAKGAGKTIFPEYVGFKSNALEYLNCHMNRL